MSSTQSDLSSVTRTTPSMRVAHTPGQTPTPSIASPSRWLTISWYAEVHNVPLHWLPGTKASCRAPLPLLPTALSVTDELT